jgi:hypothetical protein
MFARCFLAAAALAVAAVPLVAEAQSFRCVGKDGKKYYGSTIPQACLGQPIEQLNAQGMVIRRIDPEGEERARVAKEAEAARKREEDALAQEAARRNRALLATYSSEKDIEEARGRALREHEAAMKQIEDRIGAIRKRQAGYQQELEFYKGKNKPPAKLSEDISNADIDLKAQEGLLLAKKRDVDAINAKYDDDKKRYLELSGKKPGERAQALGMEKGVTVSGKASSPQDQRRAEMEAQQRASRDRQELQRLEIERENERRRAEYERRVKETPPR